VGLALGYVSFLD